MKIKLIVLHTQTNVSNDMKVIDWNAPLPRIGESINESIDIDFFNKMGLSYVKVWDISYDMVNGEIMPQILCE